MSIKKKVGAKYDTDLSADNLKEIAENSNNFIKKTKEKISHKTLKNKC